jgi:RNA polymerase sigma factor (sigma-70 family)
LDGSAEQSRWFADEVQPHAPALRAYLKNSFPTVRDVDDIVQDSLLRIWLTRLAKPVRSAKGLLFLIARHAAIDSGRRKKVSPIVQVRDLEGLNAMEDGTDTVSVLSRREKILILAQAIDDLPARCREVVILRKLKNIPQKEVAAMLDLSEKTVEAHLSRGIKRCEGFLRKRGVQDSFSDESR